MGIAFEKVSLRWNRYLDKSLQQESMPKAKECSSHQEEALHSMEATHWSVDARLVSNYKQVRRYHCLAGGNGVEFIDCIAYIKGAHFTHHVVKPASGVLGPRCASYMMKALTERVEEIRQIFLQTPVKK